MNPSPPPLDGIRVLDLSRVLAGPYCTALLSDLGADVVKIEAPGGDDSRHLGPFRDDESVYFAMLNRGKRSIALDLKDEQDLRIFWRLVDEADVVVENFRPGVTDRLGIGADALRERNPRIVVASISGFGQSGPLSHLPAYDLIVQAMSGLMAGTGPEGGPPTRVGESVGDVVAGIFGTLAIVSALHGRTVTGRGTHCDVAMLDSLLALQVTPLSILNATGSLPGPIGNRHPVSAPFDTYPTRDGLCAIAVANTTMFRRFAQMVGRPELADDPAYADDQGRAAHRAEIEAAATAWSQRLTTEEALAEAAMHGVPAGPIRSLDEALDDPQLADRAVRGQLVHDEWGTMPCVRQPAIFADVAPIDTERSRRAPALDGDRQAVLDEWTLVHHA